MLKNEFPVSASNYIEFPRAEISKCLRHPRFNIREDHNIQLEIDVDATAKLRFQVKNCSLSGISASISLTDVSEHLIPETGAIISDSRFLNEKHQFTLGRLVVRRVERDLGTVKLACSPLDSRIPVDTFLSPHLEDYKTSLSPFNFELSAEQFSTRDFLEPEKFGADLFNRTEQFNFFFKEWSQLPKYGHDNTRLPSFGTRVKLRRNRPGNRNDYLVFGSNDYLGLACHPEVIAAAKKAIDQYGFGSTGSPMATGYTEVHEELAYFLGKLLGKEDVILFNSGYAANVGTIKGFGAKNDLILVDALAHSSIQDGLAMSSAHSRPFLHNNVKHLEKLLKEYRGSANGALIITEGVFSMDGDTPPLTEIAQLAEKYNCRLMIDEAHSFGVIGARGLGCWEQHPDAKVDIVMGTFSKICGGIGGFIAADKAVTNWLKWYGKAYTFTVSIAPSTAAAVLTSLKLFTSRPEILAGLRANIKYFVAGLNRLGFDLNPSHESSVVPVIVGDEKILGVMHESLRNDGIFVIPISYPIVRQRMSRFRFTMMTDHTQSDLDYALLAIERAMKVANFSPLAKKGESDRLDIHSVN